MGKKILYISYDGMTDPLGQSQVIPYLQGLVNQGYRFTLISFEKKEKFEKLSSHIRAILDKSGIHWYPLFFTRQPPFLAKIYDVWNLRRKATALYRKEKFDLVHCRSYVPASAGLFLSRQYNVPFLFDMRGFWVDERVDNGQWNLKNPFFKFFYNRYKRKERYYFKESRHVVSLTWKGKEELSNVYELPAEKITVIPCCVDLNHFDYKKISKSEIETERVRLGIDDDTMVVSYLGSLGGWYLEKEMIDFFVELKKSIPKIKFLFITQDPPGKVFKAAHESGASEKDIIVQPALRGEVPLYLSLSNFSIFFIKDAYSKRASSPTKQGEIMAMGVPLVCNDIGDTGRIIEASKAGLLIEGFTQPAYQKVISQLQLLVRANREQLRSAAYEYYDLEKGVKSYTNIYKAILGA